MIQTPKCFAFFFLFLLFFNTRAQEQTGKRAQWFVDARFGMFIHWGIYSGAEGYWKGEKLRNDNDYAEWIQYRNRIDKEAYTTLLERFDWETIDPEAWVLLAKAAGMKYITLTAKHHDGFALWNSKTSNYNVYQYSNPKRDILKELAQACKKHDIKLGLYYSHWIDWAHPNAWDHTKEIYGLASEDYDRYWQQKVIPQMRELLTEYGDIGMIWFDMWIHHSKTIVTKAQLNQLKNLIRELQPQCLINSRLGLAIEEDSDVDFRTLGDNQLGTEKLDYPWQTPATVAHSWGYFAHETQWKSTTTLLRNLIDNVSLNGNFMLNIGPRANGTLPYEVENRLKTMGDWLKVHGSAIYESEGFELSAKRHDWGTITMNKKTPKAVKVYLHLTQWPLENQITVTGIKTKPIKIYALADQNKNPLNFTHHDVLTKITLPDKAPDPYISVLAMEFNHKPETEKGLVAISTKEEFNFNISNASEIEGDGRPFKKSRYGTIPAHLHVESKQKMKWRIYIDKPGNYTLSASYSYQHQQPGGNIRVIIGEQIRTQGVQPTGKTVGEPLQNWVIPAFTTHEVGIFHFGEKGFYTVEMDLEPQKNAPIQWQSLWMGKSK